MLYEPLHLIRAGLLNSLEVNVFYKRRLFLLKKAPWNKKPPKGEKYAFLILLAPEIIVPCLMNCHTLTTLKEALFKKSNNYQTLSN